MIVFLVFTALYHISLNAALDPLLKFLPKTLETEERRLLALEEQDSVAEGHVAGETKEVAAADSKPATNGSSNGAEKALGPHPSEKTKMPNLFTKWLRPDVYTDYHTLRKLVPRDFAELSYSDEVAGEAFHQPCIVSQPPLLWIPRDSMGISTQEVKESSKVIEITDEFCTLDDKNNLDWDRTNANSAPIYEEAVYY